MRSTGDRLREAREARGWSLEELSRRTRIAVDHIEAIEEDRLSALPDGPYRVAWVRSMCDALGVEEPEDTVERPPPTIPLWGVRAVALGSSLGLVALFAWVQWGRTAVEPTTAPPPRVPDQVVELTARANVRVTATVDGERVLDAQLPGGSERVFEAHDTVVLDVSAVEDVRLRYNGRSIVPQGRQDARRRLVFHDDEQ